MGSSKKPAICQPSILRACHRALQGVVLHLKSFTEVAPSEGDFIYFDPPYHPVSQTSSFTSYAEHGFGEEQQILLRDLCRELHDIGVKFLLSNSDTSFVRELYKSGAFKIELVKAPRMVNRNADGRGAINELLIMNYGY